VPTELFLVEAFREAAIEATLTLANVRWRMDVLDMAKVWCELFGELYIVCYLLRKGSQLTTGNGVCFV
jgi:hypothetical protein